MKIAILSEAQLKIERATSKAKEIKSFTSNFGFGKGYVFYKSQTSPTGLRISLDDVPIEANLIFGEAIYQLRSSLDVAVVTLSKRFSANCNCKGIYFPFCESQSDFTKSDVQKKLKYLPVEVKDVIYSLQPFRDGDQLFYELNSLRNTDAHNQILTSCTQRMNLTRVDPNGPLIETMVAGEITGLIVAMITKQDKGIGEIEFPLDGIVTSITPEILTLMQKHIKFITFPCISEAEALRGQTLDEALQTLINKAQNAINILETTASKIST